VNVSGVAHEMRVIKTDMEANGMMKLSAVAEDISSYDFYTPPGETSSNIQPPVLVPGTLVQFIDAPPLPVDTVQNQGLLRIGVAADGANWNGAAIYRSDDGGEDGGNTFNVLQASMGRQLSAPSSPTWQPACRKRGMNSARWKFCSVPAALPVSVNWPFSTVRMRH
jgi:hypothetical protein